jgi:hypothetical protein
MPYELLRTLCAGPIPATVEKQADIDKVAVLLAAGMIEAVLPRVVVEHGRYGYAGPAAVTKVTALGLAFIERHDRCGIEGISTSRAARYAVGSLAQRRRPAASDAPSERG